MPATLESERGCFAGSDPSDSSGKTPDVVEIDPSLTSNSVPQNPIPAFSGMEGGRWPKEMSNRDSIINRMRDGGRFFGSSLMQDMINDSMTNLSPTPDIGASTSSERLTPNSSTAASERQQRSDSSSGGREMTTGLTPGRQFGNAPETPKDAGADGGGGGAAAGDFSWDNFGGGTTGLTPMSEGVLRTMLQMNPMETMDLGWENPP